MLRRSAILPVMALSILLAGCERLPEVDGTVPVLRDAPWPQLLPADRIAAEADSFALTGADGAALQARAARLRARAAALRRDTR